MKGVSTGPTFGTGFAFGLVIGAALVLAVLG